MTEPFFRSGVAGLDRVTFDAGLRTFMQRIFGYMSGGLAITGVLAWVVGNSPLASAVSTFHFGFWIISMLMLFYIGAKANTMSVSSLRAVFLVFCGVMGLFLGDLAFYYTGASIARAFFINSATFGAMSLWGYTTKRDLTGMGAFLWMGFWGILIAMLVNLFMASSMLQWIISVAGVAIFTGLTAWDVQRLKQTYSEGFGVEANDKLAIFGALTLYLNFINAFQFLLQLKGDRRN